MKAIAIFFFLMLLTATATAETGIVVNSSGYVLYKSAVGRPSLQEGEIFVPFEDINSVLRDAKYDGVSFVNPVQPVQVQYEEKLVATTGLDPTTQAAISAITGAGAAYLVVRRKKA